MADPTVTQLAASTSTSATTTVSFSAQTAGTLLVLTYGGDNYRTTSGAGRPESSGWTLISDQHTYLGHAMWYKVAAGGETSVQYTIGSASPSAYWCGSATEMDATPLDISNGQLSQTFLASYTTPTVVTSAGRRLAFASIGGSSDPGGASITGLGTWLNSYTEIGDVVTVTAGTQDAIGVAYLIFDGGGSTSSGASYQGVNANACTGIIAAFKVAAAGAPAESPILVMAPRRR